MIAPITGAVFGFGAVLLAIVLAAVPGGAQMPVPGQRPGPRRAPRPRASQGCVASPNVALPDLTRPYRGLSPGLYPGGSPVPSRAHLESGLAQAARITPLDERGRPADSGRIVLLSLGMSNTSSEFGRFIRELRGVPAVNPRLTVVNGAMSGADAVVWANPAGPAWGHAKAALSRYSPAQVQAIWMKQAHLNTAPFPDEVDRFTADLDSAVRIAVATFPNLRIVYVSSRTRSGAETRRGPGEPQAYETAFAVRQLIERHENASEGGTEAWVSWGPYIWANAEARSDGLVWDCQDLEGDLLHPSEAGSLKVARQLLAFFMTDPTAAPWFLDEGRHRTSGPGLQIEVSVADGRPPLSMEFRSSASWAAAHYWSFGDGTSSLSATPRKTFNRPGVYDVQLTVTDDAGRWARSSTAVRVN